MRKFIMLEHPDGVKLYIREEERGITAYKEKNKHVSLPVVLDRIHYEDAVIMALKEGFKIVVEIPN